MRVNITYKNQKLEVVDTVEYDLDVYCLNLSERLIKVLSTVESLFDINILKENESYQKLRHTLLDVAGEVKRFPKNLLLEPGQKIVWDDEFEDNPDILNTSEDIMIDQKSQKPTLSLIQRLFGGGE